MTRAEFAARAELIGAQIRTAVADAAHALLVDAGNDWPGPRE